jgi:hypothetical protein
MPLQAEPLSASEMELSSMELVMEVMNLGSWNILKETCIKIHNKSAFYSSVSKPGLHSKMKSTVAERETAT